MDLSNLPILVSTKSLTFIDLEIPIPAIQAEHDGHLYASLPALCQVFGLNEQEEAARIQQHQALKTQLSVIIIINDPQNLCLRLGFIGLWLLTLPIDIPKETKAKQELISFQENAAQILEELFCEGRLTEWPLIADLLKNDDSATQSYKKAVAMMGLARDQLIYSTISNQILCE